jgi:cell wall-associated NlpC family hydrolase
MRWWYAALAACVIGGCGGRAPQVAGHGDAGGADPGDDGDPVDGGSAGLGGATLTVGGSARVTANALNLRDGVGTGTNVLVAMPCGTTVALLGGPSTTPAAGWWNVRWDGASGGPLTGWTSGVYLVAAESFLPSMCGGDAGALADAGSASDILARAAVAVGYSYYWGHGSWRGDGADVGSCSGSCPSCTHSGQYGADCSGYVAKVWQVPSASPIELDAHPFSTANFYDDQVYWTQIPRSAIQPADALVHRDATSGHIALYDSGADPFGAVWLYEARGCATGVVHDLRTVDSSYRAIRRN